MGKVVLQKGDWTWGYNATSQVVGKTQLKPWNYDGIFGDGLRKRNMDMIVGSWNTRSVYRS